jgi:hypothetical protein
MRMIMKNGLRLAQAPNTEYRMKKEASTPKQLNYSIASTT